jgi:hypothetical protein
VPVFCIALIEVAAVYTSRDYLKENMCRCLLRHYTEWKKIYLQICNFAVKQLGNMIHPDFLILNYYSQRHDSKCANTIVIICRQGQCAQENCGISVKAKGFLWLNNSKFVKWVQRFYRAEFGLDPPFNPSIYVFYELLVRQVVCIEGKHSLLQSVRLGLEYQLDVYGVWNSALIEHLWVLK